MMTFRVGVLCCAIHGQVSNAITTFGIYNQEQQRDYDFDTMEDDVQKPRALTKLSYLPNGTDIIGLAEFPHCGATWLRQVLAATAGLTSCSWSPEGQSSWFVQQTGCPLEESVLTECSPSYCPNSNEDLMTLLPNFKHWEQTPKHKLPTHPWDPSTGVMLRKTHMFELQESSKFQPSWPTQSGVRALSKLVVLLRHPVPLIFHKNHNDSFRINNWYRNALTLARQHFDHHRSHLITYEDLCMGTTLEVTRLLRFIGGGFKLTYPYEPYTHVTHRGKRLHDDGFGPYACRKAYEDLFPNVSSVKHRRLAPAIEVWKEVASQRARAMAGV